MLGLYARDTFALDRGGPSRYAARGPGLVGGARISADSKRMSWWSRLLGGRSDSELKPQRVDYLNEALALERQGDYDAALTSYRLALRDKPYDAKVLQNMAIAYTRLNRQDEAIRCYRRALEVQPSLSGAHYGLAYLLLKRGDRTGAEEHLDAFLATPPTGPDADGFVTHARQTLAELRASPAQPEGPPADPSAESSASPET